MVYWEASEQLGLGPPSILDFNKLFDILGRVRLSPTHPPTHLPIESSSSFEPPSSLPLPPPPPPAHPPTNP